MAVPQYSERVAFGPFEVDPTTGDLRKHGVRLRLSGQPFRILVLLLSRPGEVISQEELKKRTWGDGTYVDFEHGLHVAVNKLRRVLADSAENPHYIETVPGRGYRFIGVLERVTPPEVSVEPVRVVEPRRTAHLLWWIAAAVCLIAGSSIAWRLTNPPMAAVPWKLTKLTSDAGLSDSPALSRDGKLVAYSNERDGARDLYVRQIGGGQPIRLTFDGAGNTMPDFSPDGSKVVFRSNRDGGGIYELPTFGGEPRRLTSDGLNPKYSPDGTQVAFWIGDPSVAHAVPANGAVWVVSSTGGQPVRVGSRFTSARWPLWAPDGRHLLMLGYRSEKAYEFSSLDWWMMSTDSNSAVQTDFRDSLIAAGLQSPGADIIYAPGVTTPLGLPAPACWLPSGNRVFFSARNGDTRNIWETKISPEGKITGAVQRLTAGSGDEVGVSCAAGNVFAFASVEPAGSVWSLPIDLNRGKPIGGAARVTPQPSIYREGPSASADGRRFAFSSNQTGVLNIWVHDLESDKETQVAASRFAQRYPAISPSGKLVAYSAFEDKKRILYVAAPGGVFDNVCEGCLRPTDWSRDEKTLLTFGGSPYQVSLLDVDTHRQTPLLSHPTHNLLYARFSPDEHWISFTARTKPNRSQIMIAPLGGPSPIPESAWIRISEEAPEDAAAWSPDGRTLYFTSSRDGHICLWGQRIDPNSHRPIGQAFALQHFHERPLHPNRVWSASKGQIAATLMETSGSIWLMSRPATR